MPDVEAITASIRTQMKAEIEDAESITVLYDNDPRETPTGEDSWVRCNVEIFSSSQVEMGSPKRHRYLGTLTATVYARVGTGEKSALDLADLIATAFRAQTVDSVVFRTPTITTRGRDDNEWQIDVICPFYADQFS